MRWRRQTCKLRKIQTKTITIDQTGLFAYRIDMHWLDRKLKIDCCILMNWTEMKQKYNGDCTLNARWKVWKSEGGEMRKCSIGVCFVNTRWPVKTQEKKIYIAAFGYLSDPQFNTLQITKYLHSPMQHFHIDPVSGYCQAVRNRISLYQRHDCTSWSKISKIRWRK
jgi:hypothetical protein